MPITGNSEAGCPIDVEMKRITWQRQLEHRERLRSEDTPLCPMITHTIDLVILDPKWKEDTVKVTNLKNLSKLWLWKKKNFTQDITSSVAW